MKQTLEEAANEYRSENVPSLDKFPKAIKKAFIAGAEWQAKQSPWQPIHPDNLPPVGSAFVVISDTGYTKIGYMRSKERREKFNERVSSITKGRVASIWDDLGLPNLHARHEGTRWTHWMLIPKLKEE